MDGSLLSAKNSVQKLFLASNIASWSQNALETLNPLLDNKILDWSKLKQIAGLRHFTVHLKWKISTI